MARGGRFQVMAALQAAQARALGLNLDEAKWQAHGRPREGPPLRRYGRLPVAAGGSRRRGAMPTDGRKQLTGAAGPLFTVQATDPPESL